ncbi:MAG: IreB family regulatory phosphoprotein [Erysipelotrichaceae bacterium]|nr:IreB family regulatory phosphoprotein [Erysipelotrichaceae bacterium]
MTENNSRTMLFDSQDIKRENMKQLLKEVSKALEERGYNAVNQISGYLISNDPAYISSHNNARNNIQQVERYEIIEELVRYYLETK